MTINGNIIDSKQQQIIDAAKTLFGDRGYAATSVRDIAELAGLNAAAINYYFGSKEELFKIIFRLASESTSTVMTALADKPKNIEQLKMMLRNFFKLFCHLRIDDPSGFYFINRNLDLLAELDPETFKKNLWSVKQSLSDVIAKAQKSKIIRKDLDPQICASALFSSIGNLIRDENIVCKFSNDSVFDEQYRNKFINHIVNLFIDGAKENV